MAAGVVIALWVIVMAILWAWLAAAAEQPAADGPPVDPHAAAVEEFRRELHDWDRGGHAG